MQVVKLIGSWFSEEQNMNKEWKELNKLKVNERSNGGRGNGGMAGQSIITNNRVI